MQETTNPNITVLVCGTWKQRNVRVEMGVTEPRMSSVFVGIHKKDSNKSIVVGYLYRGPKEKGDIKNPDVVFCRPEEVINSNLTVEEFLRLIVLMGVQDILSVARLQSCVYLVRHDGKEWQLPPVSMRPEVVRAKAVVRTQEHLLKLKTVAEIPVYPSSMINLDRFFQKHGVVPDKPPMTAKDLRN